MKNYFFVRIALLVFALVFTSCTTLKVNYSGKKLGKIENIALISTMIGKIEQPVFPLLDAATFNSKTNKIADQIMDMQKKNVDKCREIIAFSLKKKFNCNVLFADSLHTHLNFVELKDRFDSKLFLKINNDNYQYIIAATEDINPFKFDNGNVDKYFTNTQNYKSTASEIANKLNADLVAVSYSKLVVVGVGMFGVTGNIRLDTYLYLFDKTGDLVSDAHSWSKPTGISGTQIDQYRIEFKILPYITETMMNKVAGNFHHN